MPSANPAPSSAAAAFLDKYGFRCPVYSATLTATGCEANRSRSAEERKPGCGPECSIYLEKRGTWSRTTPETPAWLLVKGITGAQSYKALAEMIGRKSANTDIGRIFADLDHGRQPKGAVWNALLKHTKLNASKLLNAGKATVATPAEELPADPVSSSPPPSGSAQPSPEPDGPAVAVDQPAPVDAEGEAAGDAEAALTQNLLEAATQAPPLRLKGADPDEQLLTAEDLDTLRTVGTGPTRGRGEPPMEAAIPADFEAYDGAARTRRSNPLLQLRADGDIELTAGAVLGFGLERAQRVRLFWSSKRRQIGLLPTVEAGPGTFKLQKANSNRRRISSAFLRTCGITALGSFPVERGPAGLLVTTITQQPAQGGEA